MSSRDRALKIALWNAEPNCFWCDSPLLSPRASRGSASRNRLWADETRRKRVATLDHIDHYNGKPVRRGRVVLACWDCNGTRGRASDYFLSNQMLAYLKGKGRDAVMALRRERSIA